MGTALYPQLGEAGYFITAETNTGALCSTLHFLPLFVIGMVLAQRLDLFSDLFTFATPLQRLALWLVAFILVRRSQEFTAGLATALLIFLSMKTELVVRAMRNELLQWLAKISYSLYLLHIPILVLTLHLLNGVVSNSFGLMVAFVLSLAISHLFENYVVAFFVAAGRTSYKLPSPNCVMG